MKDSTKTDETLNAVHINQTDSPSITTAADKETRSKTKRHNTRGFAASSTVDQAASNKESESTILKTDGVTMETRADMDKQLDERGNGDLEQSSALLGPDRTQ